MTEELVIVFVIIQAHRIPETLVPHQTDIMMVFYEL